MVTQLKQLSEPPCSLEHLRDRCVECGDCWEWRSAYRAHRWPVISFRRDWDGTGQSQNRQFYVRHLMYWHKHGESPKLGPRRALIPSCGNEKCVNPSHLKLATRKEVVRKTVDSGRLFTLAHARRVSEGRRHLCKLTAEQVSEIRLSTSPAKEAAQQYGVSQAYIYMLRRGEWRKDYSNPFMRLVSA